MARHSVSSRSHESAGSLNRSSSSASSNSAAPQIPAVWLHLFKSVKKAMKSSTTDSNKSSSPSPIQNILQSALRPTSCIVSRPSTDSFRIYDSSALALCTSEFAVKASETNHQSPTKSNPQFSSDATFSSSSYYSQSCRTLSSVEDCAMENEEEDDRFSSAAASSSSSWSSTSSSSSLITRSPTISESHLRRIEQLIVEEDEECSSRSSSILCRSYTDAIDAVQFDSSRSDEISIEMELEKIRSVSAMDDSIAEAMGECLASAATASSGTNSDQAPAMAMEEEVSSEEDALAEFTTSVMEMVVGGRVKEEDGLLSLFQDYLKLNSAEHHGTIAKAFLLAMDQLAAASC